MKLHITWLAPTVYEALKCPSCGGQAMSKKAKGKVGPAKTHPCDSCGVNVSPSWTLLVVLFAVYAVGIQIGRWLTFNQAVTCQVVGMAFFLALVYRYGDRVPLVQRKGPAKPHGRV